MDELLWLGSSMPQFRKDLPRIDALLSNATPLCPIGSCDGRMQLGSGLERLGDMGLQRMACRICRHRGFRALEGVQVLFGGRHEHVCSYGPFTHVLTVVFSEAVLSHFLDEDLSPTQAAIYAAHCALLRGQVDGTVPMSDETSAVAHCLAHLRRELAGNISGSPQGEELGEYIQFARCDSQQAGVQVPS